MRDRKEVDPDGRGAKEKLGGVVGGVEGEVRRRRRSWEESWEELGEGIEGRDTIIRIWYVEKKIYFQ
jgi:hypothetical protein